MAARRVKSNGENTLDAARLRDALDASSRIAARDPLKLRREALDRDLRDLRLAGQGSLVRVLD